MQPNSTTWRVPPLGWVPISLAIVAEAASNALRAYGLGSHLDRFTFRVGDVDVSLAGCVLVLAATAVSLSQARAAWVALSPAAPVRQRIISGMAAAMLLAISVAAIASHILEAQRAQTADEGGARGRYDRARDAHDKAAGELAALSGVRSIADVRAALDAAPVPRGVFARTRQCTDVTRNDSFRDCRPILDLRQEMGRAIRKAELEPEVKALRDELARLERPEVASDAEAAVSGLWAWILGAGVVFIATFGAVIFARVESMPPANDNRVVVPVPSCPAPPVPPSGGDSLVDWVREFRARHGRSPMIPELQARFPGTPKTTAWRRCKAAA